MAAAEGSNLPHSSVKVGWIGTGVMGRVMCGHILAAGYSVTVYNRTISKAEELQAKGAVTVDSPEAVAAMSNIVFTIVGYPSDVREVILGSGGVLQKLRPGGIVVDMTTSQPSLAKEISAAAEAQGCDAVDAPVSGGDKGARTQSLSIMVGGKPEVVEKLEPLFRLMGWPTHMGPAGAGQSCKLANQVTIASTMVGLVEGLLYAHRAGLHLPTYLAAISGGAAGSRSLDLYANRILQRDFQPGFYVKHFVKDLGIALEECRHMSLSLPGLALAQQLYVSLQAHGEGKLGTQALTLALERLNASTLPSHSL
eukprot:TRINITY_DN4807_c0_g1_i1.p1 TRINITY_DN4807_c0_g1~~TRINITY_DN4807_c0_g1_i1.p1  ORF type:complete len:334 (+),score=98.69 TRINITY_DN4807_c0_g1_i1:74-1003(+)